MKMDLVTSIAVTVVGTVLGFFVTNLVVAPIEEFSFPTVNIKPEEASAYATLDPTNPNVFNYRALNPTVEVFVGECKEYGTDGKCLEEDDGTTNNDENDDENNEDDENFDENENIDFEIDEEDEELIDDDPENWSVNTDKSLLDQLQDAGSRTPSTTTRTDQQENN